MPKLLCKCNTVINYSHIPSLDEWLLISDTEYDHFFGEVDSEELYRRFVHMLKCPTCERLRIFWEGFENPEKVYVVESASEDSAF